jgi:MFS family permease
MAAAAEAGRGWLRVLRAYAVLTYPFACVPFLYFHFRDHGVGQGQYGDLMACYYFAMVAAEVPTGMLADRYGNKPMLVAGPLLLACGFLCLVWFDSFPGFCVGEAVLGVGHSALSGPPSAVLYAGLADRGQAQRFLHEESVNNALRLLGTGVAFLAGGFLVAAAGTGTAVVLTAALCVGAAAVALRSEDRSPRTRRRELLAAAAWSLRQRGMGFSIAWFVLTFFLLRFVFHTYQPYLEHAGFERPVAIGAIFFAMNLFAAPFSRVVPGLRRRFGERALLAAVPLTLALTLAPMAWGGVWVGVAMFFVHQVPFGVHWSLAQDYVQRRIASAGRTTVLSTMSFAGRLAFGLLFPVVMRVQERHGVEQSFLLVAAAGALAAAACWAVMPREEPSR